MGLTPRLVRRVDEMHRAEDVAMVGHGYGGHAQLFHALDKLFHVTGAIEHGVIGMEVQVDELGHGWLCYSYSNGKLQGRTRVYPQRRHAGEGSFARRS